MKKNRGKVPTCLATLTAVPTEFRPGFGKMRKFSAKFGADTIFQTSAETSSDGPREDSRPMHRPLARRDERELHGAVD